MAEQKDQNTESKIREAARKVFLAKGLAGARMQDIADEAGINKALLHYYYKSKEHLFQLIYEDEMSHFFNNLQEIINAPVPLFEKIKRLIARDIDYLQSCPRLPIFLLNELTQDPPGCMQKIKSLQTHQLFQRFKSEVNEEIAKGNIRSIDPEHLFLNIIAMIVYPFIAKPIVLDLFNKKESDFPAFTQKHKLEIADFIIQSLRPDASSLAMPASRVMEHDLPVENI